MMSTGVLLWVVYLTPASSWPPSAGRALLDWMLPVVEFFGGGLMQTITAQYGAIGQSSFCLECRKTVNVAPGLAVEVATAGGTLEGYLHAVVCRAN